MPGRLAEFGVSVLLPYPAGRRQDVALADIPRRSCYNTLLIGASGARMRPWEAVPQCLAWVTLSLLAN